MPSINDCVKMLPAWKADPETSWLRDVDAVALQQSIRNFDRAYENFFRAPGKVGFPRFKSKRARQSYRTNGVSVFDARHAKLPKLGKVKARVARVQEKIANVRKDAIHKATSKLASENQVVSLEDLNVKGMLRNRRLAKAVSDASFAEISRELEYKCAMRGGVVVGVGRFSPSSKTCSDCGHVLGELLLSVRAWSCPECGAIHDRDVNAARNILAEGLRILKEEGTAGLAGTPA